MSDSRWPIATSLNPDDLSAAVSILAAAFDDEPVFSAVLTDVHEKRACLPALFRADLTNALRYGGVVCVHDPSGAMAGTSYWTMQPEPERSDSENVEIGYVDLIARWRTQLKPLGEIEGASHRRLDFLPTPWRYLAGIGVRPDLQGQGYGTAMLRYLIAQAVADGVPFALSTDRAINVTLYERLGFYVVHHEPETSVGAPFWTMLYAPPKLDSM
ncbi:MAG TPA: GNAT family N-acetyltransferase [Thermomicrobiales bacterium]|nr:GNAT family N-acetyltransferase [Thermomicrobiales bacterium]